MDFGWVRLCAFHNAITGDSIASNLFFDCYHDNTALLMKSKCTELEWCLSLV